MDRPNTIRVAHEVQTHMNVRNLMISNSNCVLLPKSVSAAKKHNSPFDFERFPCGKGFVVSASAENGMHVARHCQPFCHPLEYIRGVPLAHVSWSAPQVGLCVHNPNTPVYQSFHALVPQHNTRTLQMLLNPRCEQFECPFVQGLSQYDPHGVVPCVGVFGESWQQR